MLLIVFTVTFKLQKVVSPRSTFITNFVLKCLLLSIAVMIKKIKKSPLM